MAWPRRIYVATRALGVYYTSNFTDPGVQPTWTAVNAGLPTTDCREFHLDPFDQVGRQYVMLEASGTLYRREVGGAWASILTVVQARAVTGLAYTADALHGFCTDPTVDGRIWVTYSNGGGGISYLCVLRSDDYGDSWAEVTRPWEASFLYLTGGVRSHGATVYVMGSIGIGGAASAFYSTDTGATWNYVVLDNNAAHPLGLNHLTPAFVYSVSFGDWLCNATTGGARNDLQNGLGMDRNDSMWFDPLVAAHQRIIKTNQIHVTTDSWASTGSAGVIAPGVISFAPWAGADTDQMLVGMTIVGGTPPTQPHVIGTLYGEADLVGTGIAGTSPGTAPYTDSIPYTCGGVAQMGIQAIDATGIVHTHSVAMPGYDGTARGVPMQGDRAVWDVLDYAGRHASDIQAAALLRHLPAPAAAGNYARDDGTNWQSTAGGIPLADLLDYARGSIIRGGAADWETYDASGDGFVLIGDGTDVESRVLVEADITDLDHDDPDAIHDNVAGEIHAIADKAAPDDADEIVIEDSAGGSWTKKRVSLANLLSGTGALALLFSQVEDVTVEDTTDETTLLGSGRGSKTVPANTIDQGSVIRITGHGYLSTTGTPTLAIKVTLGGSEVCATEVFTTADTITDQGFTFRAEIVCRASGAGGSVVAGGTFEYDAGNQHKLLKTSTTAADTTAALAVDVTADWGTASASNTITCQIAAIELIKADELAVAAPGGLTAVEV